MWRQIPGIAAEINERGELRQMDTEKPISSYINPAGYVQVNVSRLEGGRTSTTVHRLMAETFFKVRTNRGNVINHKDGNKTNNHLNNLEVVTTKENIEHAYRSGLNGHSKLNADKVRAIRKMREDLPKVQKSIREIAKLYDISPSTVQSICSRRTWKHVE